MTDKNTRWGLIIYNQIINTLKLPLKAYRYLIPEYIGFIIIFSTTILIAVGTLMNTYGVDKIMNNLNEDDTLNYKFQNLVIAELKDLKAIQNHIPAYPLKQSDLTKITSRYDYRINPINKNNEFHARIDLAAKKGAPVYAPAEGIVIQAEYDDGWGNVVGIDHDGNGYVTWCSHLDTICVVVGERVLKGELIGNVGRTGLATGNHVDFRVTFNGNYINPELINYYSN